MTGRSLTI